LPDIYLYSVDDLSAIIETNRQQRAQAAAAAEIFVTRGAQAYLRERRVHQSQNVLRSFRDQAKALQDEEVAKALLDMEKGTSAEQALNRLANNLTNKLIHAPTMALRDASAEGRADLLEYLRQIYGISDNSDS
ncbi:MAG: glutamyl-tRNA reductase, partial [Pseudomonadota bacterium]